jgi:hypothetical protein
MSSLPTARNSTACTGACSMPFVLRRDPKEIVVDNMLTAVTERQGTMVRFNDAFLDFLRVFNITPVACNPGAPHEKGKVEAAIKYIRRNFWPLRSFSDLSDVQRQAQALARYGCQCAPSPEHRPASDERFETVKLKACRIFCPIAGKSTSSRCTRILRFASMATPTLPTVDHR